MHAPLDTLNPRAVMGGNQPPSALELGRQTVPDLIGPFLKDAPVIQSPAQAERAAKILDAATRTLGDIEAERDGKVRPLNTAVAEINAAYHAAHNTNPKKPGTLDKLVLELRSRITAFARAEEDRRLRALEALRRAEEEAAAKARAAEEREREAVSEAAMGVETDVADLTQEADAAFADFEAAGRQAAIAERDARVRIAGPIGRRVSLRTREVLTVTDWKAAIEELGCTPGIAEAILTAARAYRNAFGELPDGITRTEERTI